MRFNRLWGPELSFAFFFFSLKKTEKKKFLFRFFRLFRARYNKKKGFSIKNTQNRNIQHRKIIMKPGKFI